MPSTCSISSIRENGSLPDAVHLVDEGEDGDVAQTADMKEAMVCASTPFAASIQHDRAVRGDEHAVGVSEVLVTRGVGMLMVTNRTQTAWQRK